MLQLLWTISLFILTGSAYGAIGDVVKQVLASAILASAVAGPHDLGESKVQERR